jgi:FlaA1/EpsC-like NDP-sugar epimerase
MTGRKRFNSRTALAFVHDIAASAAAWCVAFWLRLNLDIPEPWLTGMLESLLYVVPVQTACFLSFGLYRGIWRYASLNDLKQIVLAVGVSALISPVLFYMLRVDAPVPRSVLILDPILLMMMMGGSRILYRAAKERRFRNLVNMGNPVIVLGAGDAAAALIKELTRSREWRVVGALDDNVFKHGRQIHGVRVLGRLEELREWAEALEVQTAIIAMPSASADARRRAIRMCNEARVKAMTIPAVSDLISGKVTVSEIRQVELEDLLRRGPVMLDTPGLRSWIRNKVVMVTGAGGSIGAGLCREIARYDPKLLILFELNEFALYTIEQEFSDSSSCPYVAVIGDVKHGERITQVIRQYGASVIFHAAAYKHVPLMQSENAWEAVRNNVLGTYVLARAAIEQRAEKLVLVSTDKAVNPTSVMGASKRLAELVCQALQSERGTKFVAVRFGNVLGSAGSVVPKFKEQIARGGPITVTDPEITRYFMSIPEACQLVLQAGLMGRGGEIFVLDMGEPLKITDLAKDLIRLSGLAEDDVEIVYTGLRPGEKLYEEPLADDERTLPTPHAKLRIAKAREVDKNWLEQFLPWLGEDPPPDAEETKRWLKEWVPEYDDGEALAARAPASRAARG